MDQIALLAAGALLTLGVLMITATLHEILTARRRRRQGRLYAGQWVRHPEHGPALVDAVEEHRKMTATYARILINTPTGPRLCWVAGCDLALYQPTAPTPG